MRGFLGGIVLGLILCGLGLATLSLWSPLAPTPELTPVTEQPVAPAGNPTGIDSKQPDPEITVVPPVSPLASKPKAGQIGSIEQIDSTSMNRPAVNATADDPAAPENPALLPRLPAPAGTVDPTRIQVVAPDSPTQDSDVGVDTTEPVVPAADDTLGAADSLFGTESNAVEDSNINTTRDLEISSLAPTQVAADPLAEASPEVIVDPAPRPDVTRGPELFAQSDPVAPKKPRSDETLQVAAAPRVAVAPVLDTATEVSDQTEQTLPRIAPLPQAGVATETTGPTIGKRVVPLTERHKTPTPQSRDALPTEIPAPLEFYAEPFENLDGSPLMSIILTDDGSVATFENLQAVPFPITVAIDPTLPNAAERMARHRGAGHEVLLLVALPRHATARDVEVSLAAGFDILPEAVGVLEAADAHGDREISAQIVAIADGTGRGVVTQNTGLNSTLKLARGNGVPSTVVYRDFDRIGQGPAAVERTLDQAVFRASQDGSVTVIGRLHPETIRILQTWVGDHRASRVAMAPVSAVLRLGDGAS